MITVHLHITDVIGKQKNILAIGQISKMRSAKIQEILSIKRKNLIL